MKKLLLILLCLPMIGFGQMNEGEDSSRCIESCSLSREYCNQKMYTDALNYWRWAFNNCPKSTENIYRDGIIIYKDLMNQATANKQAYIDTLNLIYDTRIKYFKKAPYGKEEILTLNTEAIQELDEYDDAVFMVVENMPEFPCLKLKRIEDKDGRITNITLVRGVDGDFDASGAKEYCGTEALLKYIQMNVKYPTIAKEYNITGKVYVQFVVDKDGSVINVKIARGVDENLDAEALRVIKSLPKYKPGNQRGKAVKNEMTIPINFTLD